MVPAHSEENKLKDTGCFESNPDQKYGAAPLDKLSETLPCS